MPDGMPESYGDAVHVLARTGAEPETFGHGSESQLLSFIEGLLERASDEVRRYCNRSFGQHESVDVVDGTGSTELRLRNYPVIEIESVRVGNSTLSSDAYQIEDDPANPGQNAGILQRIDRRHWAPNRQVRVEYVWGYESPPGVVKSVVEDAAVEALEKAEVDRAASGKSSESMDGYSVSWDTSDSRDMQVLRESHRERLRPLKRRGAA